ncbi:MAG: bifunctional oligoribonuclease/PAP phosphatase NrnA [Endomicrobium sp.]|jgi:phosphoesterase RecJ-like protein|nr:bifunctional oligoribonuclease/PAP phosphatase NrnA [Endomicrobium sp.]
MDQERTVLKSDLYKIAEIYKIIKKSKTFFIAGHVKPDGDSLGSALALSSFINRIGKKAYVYCKDEVPAYLKFLKDSNKIKVTDKETNIFDCAIILESMNFERMGNIITPSQVKKIINIDHHQSHTDFGDINYVIPKSSSTAELVVNIFDFMKVKLTKAEAECLYTGLVTDTGSFQNTNTTASSHIVCAKLMGYGIDINKVHKRIYENVPLSFLKLQGFGLCNMKVILNGKVSYIVLTKDMFKKSKANYEGSNGIVNYTLRVQGVKVGCVFKEINKKSTKVSLRSIKNVNLLDIVKQFNGSGHKNAAGCTIDADINRAVKIISKVLKEKFDE